MSASLDRAIAIENKAVALDKQKHHVDALEHYKKALACFQQIHDGSRNEKVQRALLPHMEPIAERVAQLEGARVVNPKSKSPSPEDSSTKSENADGPGQNSEKFRLGLLAASAVPKVTMEDVIGLEEAKLAIEEALVLPVKFQLKEDLGWTAVLLYGPPGTGKTLLAQATANVFKAHYIAATAADLMSCWQGESEKQVRQLFQLAHESAPCVVFLDEVDSLCSRRCDGENDSTRRVKNEFLTQMASVRRDGKPVVVLAATNVPWDLDPAALRRFQKRIFVGLPSAKARRSLFRKLLDPAPHLLSNSDFDELARRTEGFSAHDIDLICKDLRMEPYRLVARTTHFRPSFDENGHAHFYPLPLNTLCNWPTCSCHHRPADYRSTPTPHTTATLSDDSPSTGAHHSPTPAARHTSSTPARLPENANCPPPRIVEPSAIPIRYEDIEPADVIFPPLHWSEVYRALSKAKPAVSPDYVERYHQWRSGL